MPLYMTELAVSDWPRSLSWYRDRLDLPVLLLDERRQFALLGGDAGRLALKAGAASRPSGVTLTFLVPDLEAVHARMVRDGEPASPIADDPTERFRSFKLSGPDGEAIQVFAWLS